MSGGPDIDAPSGASDAVRARPSVFDLPAAPPTLPVAEPAPPRTFDRHAEATSHARANVAAPNRPTYRSDSDRARSVYRRANPWYRRLARGVTALCLVVIVGGALYVGARELQDYLSRDRLPGIGAELPEIRTSTFLVSSSDPAVDGTITIDEVTQAFQFTGSVGGPQAGLTLVSGADGGVLATRDGVSWVAPAPDDPAVSGIRTIVPYLLGVDGADDLISNRMRPFVELERQETEGVGPSSIERYEMLVDTEGFSEGNPLLWTAFGQQTIPSIDRGDAVPITMWLDQENVMVRLRAATADWSWERVEYSDQAFEPTTTP
jgi:hypothetical protein